MTSKYESQIFNNNNSNFFFVLDINLLSSLCIIIKIHISSKLSIMVTKKKKNHNVNGNYNHKFLDFDQKIKNHNMNGNYNISIKWSPKMEASHISMLWYCSKPLSSQVHLNKRSHVSFHCNNLLYYFDKCPL